SWRGERRTRRDRLRRLGMIGVSNQGKTKRFGSLHPAQSRLAYRPFLAIRRNTMHQRCALLASLLLTVNAAQAADADWILHHGKIVTVDKNFTVHEAIAVEGDRIAKIGTNDEVLKSKGPN